MAIWAGCDVPEDLHYDVDKDVWVRLHASGEVTLGMTDIAQVRSGKLQHIQIKKVGRHLSRGRSAATVESAKWVGPFPTPLSGTIVANNADTFAGDIRIANRDPYGEGWIVRLDPDSWDEESADLVTSEEAVTLYVARINELGVHCHRCED